MARRDRRPIPGADTAVTFNQSVWWQTADGLIHAINDLSHSHRANIAKMLWRNAASYYRHKRWFELWWAPLTGNDYLDAHIPDDLEPLDEDEIKNIAASEIAQGEHQRWLLGTVLFRRLTDSPDVVMVLPRDLQSRLVPTRPRSSSETRTPYLIVCPSLPIHPTRRARLNRRVPV